MRFKLFVLVALLVSLLAFGSPTKASAGTDESILLTSISTQRVLRGLPELTVSDELTGLSVEWSKVLAANGSLSHSDLKTGIKSNWTKLGENVGVGSSATAVAAALIASPGHLANIVEPNFTLVGVGITYSGPSMYVVEKFMSVSDEIVAKPIPQQPTSTITIPAIPIAPPVPVTTTTQPVVVTTTEPIPPVTTTTVAKAENFGDGSVFSRILRKLLYYAGIIRAKLLTFGFK